MKTLLFLLVGGAVPLSLGAQVNAAESLAVAKQAIQMADSGKAERILGNLLAPEHGLPPEMEAEAALYLAVALIQDRNDSVGAVTEEARAFRAYPGLSLSRYQNVFGADGIRHLTRLRESMIASGALPTGNVHLTGLPAGARIVVDNVPATSPDLRLLVGQRHVLHISAPHFHDRTDTLTVVAGEDAQRPEALDTVFIPPGTLRIVALPWAMVEIDGSTNVRETPVLNVKLPEGFHRITLVRSGYATVERDLSVVSGSDTTVLFSLQPDTAAHFIPSHSLRDRVARSGAPLQAALAALDRGALAEVRRLTAPADTDPHVAALQTALLAAASYQQGGGQGVDSLFTRALTLDPTLTVGSDDFDARLADLFAGVAAHVVKITAIELVNHTLVTPELAGMAGQDTFKLRVATDRPARIQMTMLDPSGDTVLVDSAHVTTFVLLDWFGRRRSGPPRPLPSGRYAVSVAASAPGSIPNVLRRELVVTVDPPILLPDPGPIPDTALVRETRGKGIGIRSLFKGLTFSGLTFGLGALGSANWQGPSNGGRLALVGISAAVIGILGAATADPNTIDPQRVAENAKRRREWDERRALVARQDSGLVAGPYHMALKWQP